MSLEEQKHHIIFLNGPGEGWTVQSMWFWGNPGWELYPQGIRHPGLQG